MSMVAITLVRSFIVFLIIGLEHPNALIKINFLNWCKFYLKFLK